jgi:pimeloyl-ACP methyl ester carboxylesterase
VPPSSISLYGFKRAADDIAELARQLGAKQIILGGHDWYVEFLITTSADMLITVEGVE